MQNLSASAGTETSGPASKKLPKRLTKAGRDYLPKRSRRSILCDRIAAADLRALQPRLFCEDCTHYASSARTCTLGYRARHTQVEQTALYNLTGTMAICRMIEID